MTKILMHIILPIIIAGMATLIFSQIYTYITIKKRQSTILDKKMYRTVLATRVTEENQPNAKEEYNLIFRWKVNGLGYQSYFTVKSRDNKLHPLYYMKNPAAATNDISKLGRYENSTELFCGLLALLATTSGIIAIL